VKKSICIPAFHATSLSTHDQTPITTVPPPPRLHTCILPRALQSITSFTSSKDTVRRCLAQLTFSQRRLNAAQGLYPGCRCLKGRSLWGLGFLEYSNIESRSSPHTGTSRFHHSFHRNIKVLIEDAVTRANQTDMYIRSYTPALVDPFSPSLS
jgi:hypothetical protein